MKATWQPTLAELPERPGVYLFRNAKGGILYIGKALNLRRRIASHFQRHTGQPAKLRRLTARVRAVTIHETGSELEALLLESRLLKRERPPFNQMSTRYSTLPFVKLTISDPFPRLLLTQTFEADGSHYLGPFPRFDHAEVVRSALQRLFPLRICDTPIIPGISPPPCTAFHVRRCAAPCVGQFHASTYQRHVANVLALVAGGREAIMQRLRQERQGAADAMLFERAEHLHTLLTALDEVTIGRPLALVPVAHRNMAVLFAPHYTRACDIVLVRAGLFGGRVCLRGEPGDRQRLASAISRCYFPTTHTSSGAGAAVADELRIVGSWLHRTQASARWVSIDLRRGLATAVESVMKAMPRLPSGR